MIGTAEKIITKLIADNWNLTPVDYDNVPFNSKRGIPYIRMQVEWSDANKAGPKRTRNYGMVFISVFTPVDESTYNSADYADQLLSLFRNFLKIRLIFIGIGTTDLIEAEANIKFFAGRVQRVGATNQWYQRNVIIPFFYDYCD